MGERGRGGLWPPLLGITFTSPRLHQGKIRWGVLIPDES